MKPPPSPRSLAQRCSAEIQENGRQFLTILQIAAKKLSTKTTESKLLQLQVAQLRRELRCADSERS